MGSTSFSDLIRGVVRIIAPLADVEDIEDITVATLEAAVEAWPRFRSKSYRTQRFWILKIARCKTMDHFRKTKRRPEICVSSLLSSNGTANNEVLLKHAGYAPSAEEIFFNKENYREVMQQVARLPEVERQALTLSCVEGLSTVEIGVAMGRTAKAIRNLIHRARKRLNMMDFSN
jgi:RNA polymerase sigma factor (sigma-70 family)